jgi:methylase of polypeptide subunit release factors
MLSRIKFEIEPLVEEMLDQLPETIWTSDTTTFFDPAIGGGQFVRAIEQRLRKFGYNDENIRNRVFGFEESNLHLRFAVNKYNLVGQYTNVSYENFLKMKESMKFDVVIGNPPYNSNDTSRADKAHRGQGDNLAKKFTVKSLDLTKQFLFFIIPYGHRTYSPALEKQYQKKGLYKINPCQEHFKNVSTNPCVFYFNKSIAVDKIEDNYNAHGLLVPNKNIGQIFKNQPGRLNREDYEKLLTDTGKYRIVVTTAIIKYTNDEDIVNQMKDNTRGNWRVVFNCTTSVKKFGKIIVEGPDSVLSKSVHCLICSSQENAVRMKDYLETQEVRDILSKVKVINACNSKKFLQYIPMPNED